MAPTDPKSATVARKRARRARKERLAPSDDDRTSSPEAEPPPKPSGGPKTIGGWLRHLFIEGPTFREILRDAYFTFDRRTLGFTRILLGFLLVMDLLRRTPDWMHMFATTGVLPAPLNLARPQAANAFTIVDAFVTPPELVALWILIFVTYVCVLVGYHTRLAHLLSVFWVASLNGRVLLIENGGYVVFNLVVMWTAFLPMGDRFSIDSLLSSLRRKRETSATELNHRDDLIRDDHKKPHVSFVGLVILLQLSAIYFFNCIHKTGPAWKKDFTAVHYVLYVDRMVTPIVGLVRESIPFWALFALTKFVVGAEAVLAFCLLSPLAKRWARLTAIVLILMLHIGFGSVFVLGPFAWSLCVLATVLFAKEDWEDAVRTMIRPHRARTVLFDPKANGALLAARWLARLDRYELLTFEEEPGLETGIAVRTETGRTLTGALGFSQIVSALPLGPVIAWCFRVPPLSFLFDALVRLFESGKVTRFFGVQHPSKKPVEREPSPVRLGGRRALAVLREIAIFVMFIGAVNQALMELWVSRQAWPALIARINETSTIKSLGWRLSPQPEVTRTLAHKLRYLQGWFMFSPNPVMDDGTIVVDAITKDGRHVDPMTGKAPDFDLTNAKSFGYNQIWSDYFNRIRTNATYHEAMRQYMLRYPERTGNADDAIVSGKVYWIQDWNPKWGDPTHTSYDPKQTELFSFDTERLVPTKRR